MANNYTPSYNQYLTQSAGYALPSSVKSYSIFDPTSNSWRRMTNDGRSPMLASPTQQQADIAGALAQARQTQGTVYPVGGMGQGQPVEMHPGYINPLAQTPVGGPRTPSPASGGGGAVPVQGQPSRASQRAVEAPASIQAGNPYMGYAESRREFEDPDAFLHETPRGTAGAQGQRTPSVFVTQNEVPAEVQQMFQPQERLIPQFDVDKADRPFLGHERDMLAQGFYRASDLANQAGQMYLGGQIAGPLINLGKGVLVGRAAQSAAPAANGSLAGFVDSLNAANTPATRALKVQEMRDIMNASRASKPIGVGRGPSIANIEATTNFSPVRSAWTPPPGAVINRVVGTPSGSTYVEKLALEAPVYPRYMNPPKPASIPNVISRADVNRASQAAENALRGRYSNVGGGLSTGKIIPRATVRLNTGDTSSIWANANRGFQRYQTLQGNPRAFEPIPSMLQQTYNARLGIPSIGFLVR